MNVKLRCSCKEHSNTICKPTRKINRKITLKLHSVDFYELLNSIPSCYERTVTFQKRQTNKSMNLNWFFYSFQVEVYENKVYFNDALGPKTPLRRTVCCCYQLRENLQCRPY